MGDGPTGERWLPVESYEGLYEVSDQGRVRSLDGWVTVSRWRTGRVLKPYIDPRTKRCTVKLSKFGRTSVKLIPHLVARAFIGPRPDGQVVRHWNDDPRDNRVENLLYGTSVDNMQDCIRNGHNASLNREVCPRDHVLEKPNLVRGHHGRTCLACARAATWVYNHPGEDFATHADLYYEAIMAGRPMEDRAARITYVNAAKTKCIRDHELSGPNLKVVVRPTRTYRNCRSCVNAARVVQKAAAHGVELDLKTEADRIYRELMGPAQAA